ncbi:MAG: YceI family protein, partial [Mycobacteriales bacterium]
GSFLLRTGVEGRAARLGHDLTIALTSWECRASLNGDGPVTVELRADLPSLDVVRGDGGLKPLSDKDKRTIRDNALRTLHTVPYPQVVFTSTSVEPTRSGWRVIGDLTLHGVTRQVAVDVAVDDTGEGQQRLTATAAVMQSQHGIRPYSAMLGGLQVKDKVEVRVEAVVPRL